MNEAFTYNLDENIIKKLVDFADENYLQKGRDLSRLAFVFGGKRPSLFLKKEIATRVKGSFFSPKFFSIQEFINYIIAKKDNVAPVSDLDMCYMVYNIAKASAPGVLKGREKFSQFLPWAYEILAFIEKLDIENIKHSSLKNIEYKARIGYDVPESINKLLESVITIRNEYHDKARKEKKYSRGIKYLLASEYIKETGFEEFDDILFCDLFYLGKTELDIVKTLYDKGKAILFFQGDKKEWPVLDKLTTNLGISAAPEEKKETVPQNITLHAGFDVHSQACIVREILKEIKGRLKGNEWAENTVIVLPDPDEIIPVLSEIGAVAGDLNVSLGYPLKRSSIYSLFEYIFNAQNTKKESAYYTRDYLRALSHPFVKNLKISGNPVFTRIIIHKIEELLKGTIENPLNGSLFIDVEKLEQSKELQEIALAEAKTVELGIEPGEIEKIIKTLHELLFVNWEKIRNFREFSNFLEKFLNEIINNSMIEKYPLNIRIADNILSIKDELKNVSFSTEEFLREEIFKIFIQKMENGLISFSGSPLKGLQVLGLFETRSLSFENVIVVGVNEGMLPKLRINEPLIPREVMLGLGLDTLGKEEEIQRYHFKRLISGAKNVYLVFNENIEKDREKSRFIEEIIWENQKKTKKLEAMPIKYSEFSLDVLQGKRKVEKNAEITGFLEDFTFSASSIDTYLHCPMRFYYRYVLGLEEKDDMLGETEGADIGNFVHDLLENTYKKFLKGKFEIDGQFQKYFWEEFNALFEETFSKKMQADAFLIKSVLEYRLKQFLVYESEARIGLKKVEQILSLEKNVQKIEIRLDKSVYKFKGRIDRIDKLADGSILVLDYKTGSVLKKPSSGILKAGEKELQSREFLNKKIGSFQLPLYAYMFSTEFPEFKDNELNAGLYDLRNIEIKYLFESKPNKPISPEEKKELMAVWMSAFNTVLSEILNPKVPFTVDETDARQCENCPFLYLCR